MSNDVQSHEDVAERVAGEERRAGVRHAARSLGSVTARIIGGSQVDLVNFSNRGVLFECDSRLLIGARASVRITTTDANLIVTGRVVRSRVKGLVNGALRYDAALVLDTELGLVPTLAELPAASGDTSELDELVAFETELDATFDDPSPVEAYLAESEASLLEVAPAAELPLHEMAPEPPPLPALADTAIDVDEAAASAEPEPIAFEDDGDIAFEPAVEFAFDDAGEPSFADVAADGVDGGAAVLSFEPVEQAAAEEPAGSSMFDATYMPPALDETVAPESQFDVRPPRPAVEATPSSFFDARPSDSYGEAVAETAVAFEAETAVAFEADAAVAFEAEDAVLFEEAAFEAAPMFDEAVAADPVVTADPVVVADEQVVIAADEPDAFAAPVAPDAPLDDLIDSPAAVSDTEDRVLLQFAATVPHDLAELRRIAADNQW